MKASSIITDLELALAHLLLQNTDVHLFLKQESTRNPCVLGGVQKSWNPGKEFRKWLWSWPLILWWEALNPQQLPTGSYTWASKREWPHHKTLDKTAGRLILPMPPVCQSLKCHFLQQVTLKNMDLSCQPGWGYILQTFPASLQER